MKTQSTVTGFVFWGANWKTCYFVLRGSVDKPIEKVGRLLSCTSSVGMCRYINILHRCESAFSVIPMSCCFLNPFRKELVVLPPPEVADVDDYQELHQNVHQLLRSFFVEDGKYVTKATLINKCAFNLQASCLPGSCKVPIVGNIWI